MSINKEATVFCVHLQQTVSAGDLGKHLAFLGSEHQAATLMSFVDEIEALKKWPMQCSYIVDNLNADEKVRIKAHLDIFLDHLREDQP